MQPGRIFPAFDWFRRLYLKKTKWNEAQKIKLKWVKIQKMKKSRESYT